MRSSIAIPACGLLSLSDRGLPFDARSKRKYTHVIKWGERMSKPTDLVQGTVDLLILKTIALGPMHGWAIAQRIKQVSNDV